MKDFMAFPKYEMFSTIAASSGKLNITSSAWLAISLCNREAVEFAWDLKIKLHIQGAIYWDLNVSKGKI